MRATLKAALRAVVMGLALGWLLPVSGEAEPLIDLTAELDGTDWGYMFFYDGTHGPASANAGTPRLYDRSAKVHCVVGTNRWFMESLNEEWAWNSKVQIWFTGTNIVKYDEIIKPYTDGTGCLHPVGEHHVKVLQSCDGNPARPIKVVDLLDLGQQIPWVAFCSGSVLRESGHRLNPPWGMWKNMIAAPHGFSDQATVYHDAFGLPINLKLVGETSQPIFQYQVHETTNVMGLNFPQQFYMVQYEPDDTNGWVTAFTARGRITAIRPGKMPPMPGAAVQATGERPPPDAVVVQLLTEPLPHAKDKRAKFLWDNFANQPTEQQFNAYTTEKWKDNFSIFADALVQKANNQALNSDALRRILDLLLRQTKGETAYLPVGAHQTTLDGSPIWIVTMKWESPSTGDAANLAHTRIVALDQKTLKNVAFIECL